MPNHLHRSFTFEQALADFAAKVGELTKRDCDGRSYVLVEQLKKWMREDPSRTGRNTKCATNTELLAHAAYFDGFAPIHHSYISDAGADCCLIVFSILLDLNLGHNILIFSEKGIVDGKLPVDLFSLKKKLGDIENGDQVAERFTKRQWKFCPAVFELHMNKEYYEERIIPICRKKQLGSGGIAVVWQIAVPSESVTTKLSDEVKGDASASYHDPEHGPCYVFALKEFQEGNFDYYDEERTAFDGLRTNGGFIRRLGCYSHRIPLKSDASRSQAHGAMHSRKYKNTKNLLLEYGRYDLNLIFGFRLPPSLPKEILAFWEALFEVAKALRGIHNFKAGGNEFYGWHADLKPENIINVGEKYKLSDPGFARFKKKAHDLDGLPRISLHGGTATYGAPEVTPQATVDQSIDIWSLGCVFSVAATWVVLGYQGVRQYQKVREKALESLLKSTIVDRSPLLNSQNPTANSKPERRDCFHNNTEVIDEVTSWHALLKTAARKTDPITEQVLDLIDRKILLRHPEDRIKSGNLCQELEWMVLSCTRTIEDTHASESLDSRNHRMRIESLLREIDNEAAFNVQEEAPAVPKQGPTPDLPIDRHALQVQLENVALRKTSHRYAIQPGTVPKATKTLTRIDTVAERAGVVTNSTGDAGRPPQSAHIHIDTGFTPASGDPDLKRNSTFGQQRLIPVAHRRSFGRPITHRKQSAIQAHENLNREQERKGIMWKKSPKKDEFLSMFFEDRDIKFLVDNAETMSEHWDEATFLLETLVRKSHGQDRDGLDLDFTRHPSKLRSKQGYASFRKAMEDARPSKDSHVHTQMSTALESILQGYLSVAGRARDKKTVKALTIIILTDGLWEGMADKNDVEEDIVRFYNQLVRIMGAMKKKRQVSIQFIQFGDNKEARENLRHLDNDGPFRGIEDIVDHEEFSVTGNIYKMLLGSFVEEIDAIDDSVEHLSTAN